MKKSLRTILAAVLIMTAATGCAKEGTRLFRGNYSFKTSGTITIADSDGAESTISIPTESGQMDITETDRDGGSCLVTMNVIGGDMLVFNATAKEDKLAIKSTNRLISFSTKEISIEDISLSGTIYEADLLISGKGSRYDNIVIIDFNYSGSVTIGNEEYNIIASDVKCRAKLNED